MTDDGREQGVDAAFQQLTIMLASAAMQQLGKVVNPATGKAETDLEGAQAAIDLLEMVERKTRGNLTRDESRMLGDTLMMLRLNFVETAQSGGAEAAAAEQKPAEPAAQAEAGGPRIEVPPASSKPPDEGGPRFHKTYG